MSSASREAKCCSRPAFCAGQLNPFSQTVERPALDQRRAA
jgi:hypothetical protein